jgi:hypothetical protein
MTSGPIGFWQLADLGGTEPGVDARLFAAQQVSDVLRTSKFARGPLSHNQILVLGDRLSSRLIECLRAEMAQYDADLLVPALVGQNDLLAAVMSLFESELAQPIQKTSLPFPASFLNGLLSITTMPQISLRFVLEFAAAQPPTGTRGPDRSGIQQMWGLAEKLLEVGAIRDLAHSDIERMHIERDGNLLYLRPTGSFDAAMRAQVSAFSSARIERLRGVTNNTQPRVFTLVKETLEELVELDGRQFVVVMLRAKALSDERDGSVCIAPQDSVISAISKEDIPSHAVRRAIDWLSLAPVSDFSPSSARYPWRFRRSHSYVRRPFVRREIRGQDPVLIWGGNHMLRSLQFLTDALMNGTLPSEGSKRVEVHNGTLGDWRGSAFEEELTQLLLRRVPEMWIRSRVEKLGERELGPGAEPLSGDIDVLIGDSVRRCLTLVEAKAGLLPFSAYDVAGEVGRLTASDTPERSDLDKHLSRLAWAERHLEGLVRLSGFGSSEGWKVQGRWVTKEPVASAFLSQMPVKITPIFQLRDNDIRDWLSPDGNPGSDI